MASDFLASGAGSASGDGVAAIRSPGSAAGVASSSVVGVRAKTGGFSSSGVSGGSVVGRVAIVGVGNSNGASVASYTGIAKAFTTAFGAGTSAAIFVGVSAGVFGSAGTSDATSVPSTMNGSASGSSTAEGLPSSSLAQSAGSASTTSSSSMLWGGRFASSGASPSAAVGGVSWASFADETDSAVAVHGLTASATGNATSTASTQVAVYSSAGSATDELSSLEKRNAVGSSAAISGSSFKSLLEESQESTGSATDSIAVTVRWAEASAGASVDVLDGQRRANSRGMSAGIGSVVALGVGGTNGVGSSIGISDTSWRGRAVLIATAEASGASAAQGALVGSAHSIACSYGAGSAAGAPKGKQIEILVSSAEAEESMKFPAPSVYPVFWSNTIGSIGATWEGLPFNSMIEVDGVMYAAGSGGLFQLSSLGDDAGSDVPSMIEWDLVDINHSDYKQRTRSIYINAQADGPFTVKVENKQGAFSYQTHLPSSSKMVNHRAPLGRGITSRAMRLTLQQTRYCSVADINIGSGDTTRRI